MFIHPDERHRELPVVGVDDRLTVDVTKLIQQTLGEVLRLRRILVRHRPDIKRHIRLRPRPTPTMRRARHEPPT